MQPRFSVIVPLYNKADYVRRTLESILAQSYTNYEVVIIDDGSTDNSLAIVNDFVKTVESGKWKVSQMLALQRRGITGSLHRMGSMCASSMPMIGGNRHSWRRLIA